MKLTKRPNGVWAIRYRDESGKRRVLSTGCRDRAAAEEEATRIMRGESPKRKLRRMTLEAALWDTYERIWSKQKSAHEKRYMVGWLARSSLGGMDVADITYPELAEWVAGLNDLAPATINRKLATISKALGEAVKLGYLTTVPPMPRQVERNKKIRWLSKDEEESLLSACDVVLVKSDADAMRSLIEFLADTGARLSEALKASREHRTGQTAVTFTETKNGRSRTVPMTDRAAVALTRIRRDWSKDKCVRLFTRVRNEAGLPDVTLHVLRHTCASRLVQGGMDLYRVKTWLGHSTITVTERYAHLAPSSLADGASILGQSGTIGADGGTGGTGERFVPPLRVVK